LFWGSQVCGTPPPKAEEGITVWGRGLGQFVEPPQVPWRRRLMGKKQVWLKVTTPHLILGTGNGLFYGAAWNGGGILFFSSCVCCFCLYIFVVILSFVHFAL